MNSLNKCKCEKCRLYHAIDVPCKCVPPFVGVFTFAAWLTTRKRAVTLSSSHNADPAAELAGAFCESQGWDVSSEEFDY